MLTIKYICERKLYLITLDVSDIACVVFNFINLVSGCAYYEELFSELSRNLSHSLFLSAK